MWYWWYMWAANYDWLECLVMVMIVLKKLMMMILIIMENTKELHHSQAWASSWSVISKVWATKIFLIHNFFGENIEQCRCKQKMKNKKKLGVILSKSENIELTSGSGTALMVRRHARCFCLSPTWWITINITIKTKVMMSSPFQLILRKSQPINTIITFAFACRPPGA